MQKKAEPMKMLPCGFDKNEDQSELQSLKIAVKSNVENMESVATIPYWPGQ